MHRSPAGAANTLKLDLAADFSLAGRELDIGSLMDAPQRVELAAWLPGGKLCPVVNAV